MKATALLTLLSREWRTGWRDWTGYLLRGGYALLLLLIAGGAWVAAIVQGHLDPESYPRFAREVFRGFIGVQFWIASALAVAVYSRAMTREKERDSLDLLLLSRASPFGILAAKMSGQLAAMTAALAAGLPVLIFLLPVGGMDAGEIVAVHLILVGQLAALGGLCALLSACVTNAHAVMLAGWGILFLGWAGPAMILDPWPKAWLFYGIAEVNPFSILQAELRTVTVDFRAAGAVLGGGLAWMGLLCAAGALLLEWTNARRKEKASRPGLFYRLRMQAHAASSSRAARALFRPVIRWSHPLVRRECAMEGDMPFRLGWLAFAVLFTVAAIVLCSGPHAGYAEAHLILAGIGGAAALFLTMARGAVAVALDRKNGLFETYLAANVDPEQVVRAKWFGLIQRAAYLLVLPVLYAAGVSLVFPLPAEIGLSGMLGVILGRAALGLALGVLSCTLLTVEVSLRAGGVVRAVLYSLVVGPGGFLAAAVMLTASTLTLVIGLACFAALLSAEYARAVNGFPRSAMIK